MSLDGMQSRTKTVNTLRQELVGRGFMEFLPQFLEDSQPLEPAINLVETLNHKFLSTSPESYLKKAMAAGSSNCFAFGHCFRNQEQENELHSLDFLMLEFYLKNAGYQKVMDLTQELVSKVLNINSTKPWPRISIIDLWEKCVKNDLMSLIDEQKMYSFAKDRGYFVDENSTWEKLFTQILFNEIEPRYSSEPFFLIDFPSKISPLAKPKNDQPEIAQRFELLINKIELADGNTENFDYQSIEKMMAAESKKRNTPYDKEFIKALKNLNGQKWAGVGIGIDRLAMMAGGFSSIKDIQNA